MESGGVSLPLFHEHPMIPWNDLRKGDCCRLLEYPSDGYYCKVCDFFFHKKCSDKISEFIDHPSHPNHTLRLRYKPGNACDLCEKIILNLSYRCEMCDFEVDFHCTKYTPPKVVKHLAIPSHHNLALLRELNPFDCSADGVFPYECDVDFPADQKHPTEVNHPYHYWHPIKLHRGPIPEYSDGECRLCGREVDEELFYHCSSCNFTLDWRCGLEPPPRTLLDLKVHDHQLTLLPRLDSFTCNACGLKGDRSPFACFHCGFMIHQDCLALPRVININRHDHRISLTSVLGDGAMNSVCGVCRKKVDWTCGGFSCQRCPGYVVHSKCATRDDVWNGEELEEVPEEEEDIEPYVVIDDNTIQHFSHKEHHLKLNENGVLYEEKKRCNACAYHIGLQSFYGCMVCDFSLHQKCAKCPKKKRHVLHNDRLTLDTNKDLEDFFCDGCKLRSNGFMYQHGCSKFDILCGSVTEPFVHPSHPHHPLYYIPTEIYGICNGCNSREDCVLRCIEGDCGFVLCFKCATLPQVVKHRVHDHPLSLFCGEEETSGKHWCDICEKETNAENWFYTFKDHRASLHTECVLGDLEKFMPGSILNFWDYLFEVMLNNGATRPFCRNCKSRCMYPFFLKDVETSATYICSYECA